LQKIKGDEKESRRIPAASSPERCPTPLPDVSDTTEVDDAWNPDSRTPLPFRVDSCDSSAETPRIERPVHWLENDKLKNTRIKLFIMDHPENVLEFKAVVNDDVKVRDGFQTKNIPIGDIFPVRPAEIGNLVTLITGPTAGVALKVRKIEGKLCTVRRPGKVLKKRETDPSYLTDELVQIYPYTK
jgi:hypothetical protein